MGPDPEDGAEAVAGAVRPDRRVEVYRDAAYEYRWRRVAANGEVVADSGEGYTRKADAAEAAEREFPDDPLHFVTT